jgi:hypothetical protein
VPAGTQPFRLFMGYSARLRLGACNLTNGDHVAVFQNGTRGGHTVDEDFHVGTEGEILAELGVPGEGGGGGSWCHEVIRVRTVHIDDDLSVGGLRGGHLANGDHVTRFKEPVTRATVDEDFDVATESKVFLEARVTRKGAAVGSSVHKVIRVASVDVNDDFGALHIGVGVGVGVGGFFFRPRFGSLTRRRVE